MKTPEEVLGLVVEYLTERVEKSEKVLDMYRPVVEEMSKEFSEERKVKVNHALDLSQKEIDTLKSVLGDIGRLSGGGDEK